MRFLPSLIGRFVKNLSTLVICVTDWLLRAGNYTRARGNPSSDKPRAEPPTSSPASQRGSFFYRVFSGVEAPHHERSRASRIGSLAAELCHRVSAKPDRMRCARCLPLRASKPWLNINTFRDLFVSDPLHSVDVVGIYVRFSVTTDNPLNHLVGVREQHGDTSIPSIRAVSALMTSSNFARDSSRPRDRMRSSSRSIARVPPLAMA